MGLFSLIGGLIGGNKQAKAADRASELQYRAAEKGIAEQARQFDLTREDFASERALGEEGISGFRALGGLSGADEQEAAISALRESPFYQSLYRNGQDAILAAASATGGLRGGDTQAALYELGEDTLSRAIERQLGIYGSAIDVGRGADTATGQFGANSVAQQSQLRNQGAAAQAQSQLVRGGIAGQNWSNAGGFLDKALGSFLGGGF